jgi:hypothetical protein
MDDDLLADLNDLDDLDDHDTKESIEDGNQGGFENGMKLDEEEGDEMEEEDEDEIFMDGDSDMRNAMKSVQPVDDIKLITKLMRSQQLKDILQVIEILTIY